MKTLLSILLLIAAANVAVSWDDGLKVKFNIGLNPGSGKDYLFHVPRTVPEALENGLVLMERPPGPLEQLSMYCFPGYFLCVLFDDLEDVAGLQIGLPENKFVSYYDFETRGFTKWNIGTDDNYIGTDDNSLTYWTMSQYLVSEEYLAKSKSERQSIRDSGRLLKDNGVWVTGIKKELVKISTSEDDIKNTVFTEQACIPFMGKHYYYNMTKELPCTAETLFPWFPLTVDGELVGTGFLSFGTMPIEKDQKDWFERPDKTAVSGIVPHGPECLYELADNPGLLTMHIYYIGNPWGIFFCG